MDKTKLVISTYNKVAQKYTQAYFGDQLDLPYIHTFISLLPTGARVFDIGCGPGTITQYLVKKFYVEGIDLSEEMLNIAKQKVPEATYKIMDMRKLAYKENTFMG